MRVDVEMVDALRAALDLVNRLDLKDIEWFNDGEPLAVPPESLEEFRFTGLNNTDFVLYRCWEPGMVVHPEPTERRQALLDRAPSRDRIDAVIHRRNETQ